MFMYILIICIFFFFFSSRRRHTRWSGDWSSDVCSSDLSFVVFLSYNSFLQIQSDRKGSHFVQNRCHNDYLYISGQLMCGSLRRGQRVISAKLTHKPQVVIGFRSDKQVSFRGFRLKWQLETFWDVRVIYNKYRLLFWQHNISSIF